MSELDLDALQTVAKAATPGTWRAVEGDLEGKPASEYVRTLIANREADGTSSGRLFLTMAPNDIDPEIGAEVVPALTGDGPRAEANAAHIATFDPPTVLALLAEVAALRAKVAEVEAAARLHEHGYCETSIALTEQQARTNAALRQQVADLTAERDEARGERPSGFWSQRQWEDWSNELAMLIPDDLAAGNPEGAQESIIEATLEHLIRCVSVVDDTEAAEETSAAQAEVIERVREWANQYRRQWVPGDKPPGYDFNFDGGVGAAAHDVLNLLAALAPLDAPAEEEPAFSCRFCDYTSDEYGDTHTHPADLPAPTGATTTEGEEG